MNAVGFSGGFGRSQKTGKVVRVKGDLIYATVPEPFVGEICYIDSVGGGPPLQAEVVGFQGDAERSEALLMPFAEVRKISHGANVRATGRVLDIAVGKDLLGRALDGLGNPPKNTPPIAAEERVPIYAECPDSLTRKRIREQLALGIKSIDAMLPCGYGQRFGVFAQAGGGKSTLMGMIARFAAADVKVVVLVGERRREVLEFQEDSLGEQGRASSVLLVAASDEPAVVRIKAAYAGMAIAEYFRDKGLKVIFMMDSVTRFARAQREIGLARGEPPTRRGFPPSVFAELPRLFERCGNTSGNGSITGIFTVLVEGDDFDEPVSDESKSLLDGHIILSGGVGYRPSVELLRSESRVRDVLTIEDEVKKAARKVQTFLRYYQKVEPDMAFGFLEGEEGERARPKIAQLKNVKAAVDRFMSQDQKENVTLPATKQGLVELAKAVPDVRP